MDINVFSMLWDAFLQQPFWMQAVLVLAIVVVIGSTGRETVPRRRRWRRRNRWDD